MRAILAALTICAGIYWAAPSVHAGGDGNASTPRRE